MQPVQLLCSYQVLYMQDVCAIRVGPHKPVRGPREALDLQRRPLVPHKTKKRYVIIHALRYSFNNYCFIIMTLFIVHLRVR